jgi:endonuclease/exonuclease/phosphatase family metal-dependent hydrolase
MGDRNAKIGKEEYQKKVAEKYTIHDISNENGNLLGESAIRHIHLGTWKILESNEVNQIDHVLVSLRHATSIIDVRSRRGPILSET